MKSARFAATLLATLLAAGARFCNARRDMLRHALRLGLVVGLAVLLPALAQAQIAFRAAAQAGTAGASTIVFRAAASAGVGGGTPAVTVGTIASASANGGNTTLDVTGVNLNGQNAVVVFVGYNNDGGPPEPTVTSVVIDPGGANVSMGAPLANIFNTRSGNDDAHIYVFGLVNPPQGSNLTIRVTFSAALLANHGSNIVVYPLSGVDTTAAFGTPGTNENDSANGNVTVPSATGELVLAGVAGEAIGASTVAAPATEDRDIVGGSGGTIFHMATARQNGAATSVNFTWTHLNDHWAAAGVSVRPAATSGLTVSKPAGTLQNDVMIASVAVRPQTVTIGAPAGWTLVRRMDSTTGTANSLAVYRKVAGASEPPSYTWTLSAHTGATGGILAFSGVDTTTPVDVENGAATAASYTPATPSVNTTVANTMLVTSHGIANADAWAYPPTSGMTQGYQGIGGTQMIQVSYAAQAAAGATGTKTATDLGPDAADGGNAHILALRPGIAANLTINKPTGTVQNDVMIASVAVRPSTVTITAPAGWTLVRRIDNTLSTTNSLAVYRKLAGASEPANYTWTLSAHTGAVGGIASFSGVDTTTPIDIENGQVWTGTTNQTAFDVLTPSVTTTVANAMLVTSYAVSSSGTSGSAWTPPTGMIEAVDLSSENGTAGESIELNYALQASAGATGTKTATVAGHDDGDGAAHILALRPAIVAPGPITAEQSISACVAPAGIAVVAAAQAGTTTTTLTIAKPAGTVQNHVMVASIAFRPQSGQFSSNITVTDPPGWTRLAFFTNTANYNALGVYYRVAGASEPASYDWGFACNASCTFQAAAGGIVSFSGVDTTSPIDQQAGAATAATYNPLTPAVTTTVDDAMLVTAHAIDNNDPWQNPPPSGMTQAFQQTTSAQMIQVSTALQASAGSTGQKQATDLGIDSADIGHAHILSLRPASATTLTLPSWTPLAGELLLVGIAMRDETIAHSVSGNGLTWTLIADRDNDRGQMGVALYRASGSSPTAGAITITLTGNTKPVYAAAVRLSGVDTAVNQGIEAIATASGPAGTDDANMKVTVTTVTANAMALAWGGQRGSATLSVPAPETIIIQSGSDCGTSGDRMRGHMWQEIVATPGPTELGQNNSLSAAHPWAVIGVSIKPLGGTPPPPPPGSFNAFETSTAAGAITGVIKTRISGVAFSLDVVAIASGAQLSSFTDQVIVEVLGNNTLGVSLDGNNCPTSFTLLQTVSPNPTITTGRSTVSIAAIADSWRDARVRVRWPTSSPTVTSCSSDNFAIRPDQFTSFSMTDGDWETAGTTRTLNNLAVPGGIVHKAGRPFTVRATAVNGAGSPATTTNYVYTPTVILSTCTGSACTAGFGTFVLGTGFVAGQLTANGATYSEVGSFRVRIRDTTFSDVDLADSSGSERNVSSSNIDVGRFVPDHFAVSPNAPLFGTPCSGFGYLGQAFNYVTAPVMTVTAQNFTDGTTTNYAGALWQITNASLTGKAYSAATGTLDTSGLPGTDPVITPSGAGVGTLTFGSGSGLFFTHTAQMAPFNAELSLGINVIDADNVAYASNPARFGQPSAGLGIAFDGGKGMRFGRLRLQNAIGSEMLPLSIPVETQYWSGTGFETNTLDSCTSIPRSAFALDFTPVSNLVACETAMSAANLTMAAGAATLTLTAPGAGNNGSVLVTANLGSAGGSYCNPGSYVAATNAGLSHLLGRWNDAADPDSNPATMYDDKPSARAAFGVYGSQPNNIIYLRENY